MAILTNVLPVYASSWINVEFPVMITTAGYLLVNTEQG